MHLHFRKTLLYFFLLTIIPRLSLAQGHEERLRKINVLHYTFALELTDTTDEISGRAEIKIEFNDEAGEFFLDLAGPSANGKGMRVEAVTSSAKAIPFEQRGDSLLLHLPARKQRGDLLALEIDYRGIPADGLIISRNKYGARTFFGDNWPNRARHWLPCVDHPSDKATVEFIVTAPGHYQVIANGRQVEETNLNTAVKLSHWYEAVPLPTKVMVIGVAPFAVQHLREVEKVPLSSWVFPEDREAGFYDYAQAEEILEWFIAAVGPYPYEKLANVQSKTRYGGMENAGNIFYSENSVTGNRSSEALIAHEIAHQWFGNSASEANWHHLWLSEGFATYFTDLYMEAAYGRSRLVERMQSERATVQQWAKSHKAPVVDTTVTDYNRLLNPNSYQKGGWVLHMLRRRLGDDDFWQGIRTYYDRYKIGNALTSDFKNVMEEISGKTLDVFFQQWLFTAGHPVLVVEWEYDDEAGIFQMEVRQTQPEGPFRFPLEIAIAGPRPKNIQQLTLDIHQQWHRFSFPLDFSPQKITLDPDTWLLFEGEVRKR
jgi:aminopeptidase N